jgi:osmotically-inducible protein OsmY
VKATLLTLFIAVVLVGCNSQDATDLKRDASQLGKTASRAATNATVAGKVETALALRKGVNIKTLHIEATGSTVTISGHVGSALEKQSVLDVANETVGVDRVVDQINVAADTKKPDSSH